MKEASKEQKRSASSERGPQKSSLMYEKGLETTYIVRKEV